MTFFLLAFCNSCKNQEQDQLLDINSENIQGFDYNYFTANQNLKQVLPLFPYLIEKPMLILKLSSNIKQSFENTKDIQSLFANSYKLLGYNTGGSGPPIAKSIQTVSSENQITEIIHRYNIQMNSKSLDNWNKLPFAFKKAIIELLLAHKVSSELIDQNIASINVKAVDKIKLKDNFINNWEKKETFNLRIFQEINKFDLNTLSLSTRILAEYVNPFLHLDKNTFSNDFESCELFTPFGEILINGVKNDTIKPNFVFVFELGGNDFYLGNEIRKSNNTIIIDFNGNDTYSDKLGHIASAILGNSFLIDLSGDDLYHSSNSGLAFSFCGSSLLYDLSGNDRYVCDSKYGQATSFYGASMLIDVSGDDSFIASSYSQGFGGTMGVGLLINYSGNDKYNKEQQLKPSFVLGSAKGRWAEATDGKSLGGGIGIFLDNDGNDEFYSNSFSQGASYYFGLGFFNDNIGDDEHNCISHSQGYAAHYSIACFHENGGNDIYNLNSDKDKLSQVIGSGRDHSVGFFIEKNGNDMYYFGNRSLGIGDFNGIGAFIDENGNDNYYWSRNSINKGSCSIGKIFHSNNEMKTNSLIPDIEIGNGIFIDKNGKDTYD